MNMERRNSNERRNIQEGMEMFQSQRERLLRQRRQRVEEQNLSRAIEELEDKLLQLSHSGHGGEQLRVERATVLEREDDKVEDMNAEIDRDHRMSTPVRICNTSDRLDKEFGGARRKTTSALATGYTDVFEEREMEHGLDRGNDATRPSEYRQSVPQERLNDVGVLLRKLEERERKLLHKDMQLQKYEEKLTSMQENMERRFLKLEQQFSAQENRLETREKELVRDKHEFQRRKDIQVDQERTEHGEGRRKGDMSELEELERKIVTMKEYMYDSTDVLEPSRRWDAVKQEAQSLVEDYSMAETKDRVSAPKTRESDRRDEFNRHPNHGGKIRRMERNLEELKRLEQRHIDGQYNRRDTDAHTLGPYNHMIDDIERRITFLRDQNRDLDNRREVENQRYTKLNLSSFSGSEPVPKNEVSFDEFRLEVENLAFNYTKKEVMEGIRKSLKGPAKRMLLHLGPSVSVTDALHKLENAFGSIADQESVLTEFRLAEQRTEETITEWSLRLQALLLKASRRAELSQMEREKKLRDRFWRGRKSDELKNATRVYYHSDIDFEELRSKVREEEFQIQIKEQKSKSTQSITKLHQVTAEQGSTETELLTNLMMKLEALDTKVDEIKKAQKESETHREAGKRGGYRRNRRPFNRNNWNNQNQKTEGAVNGQPNEQKGNLNQ